MQQQSQQLLLKKFTTFPQAIGGGIWYQPFVLEESIEYFGAYAFQSDNGVQFTWDLNTPEYDYHQQDWYQLAFKTGWQDRFDLQAAQRPLFWTEPYFDDTGTFSLMMTVDVVMKDTSNQPIGLATVDWSLLELTSFLNSVKISPDSYPFFIHKKSGRLLSYPKNKAMLMKPAAVFSWGTKALMDTKNELKILPDIKIDGINYNIYFMSTDSGFVFGSLVPETYIDDKISQVTTSTLLAASVIGLGFIVLMLLLMRMVFSPIDEVLFLIKGSMVRQEGDVRSIKIKPLNYTKQNEFTPITQALDEIYHQISDYLAEIIKKNRALIKTKAKIAKLNNELEAKVEQRTEQLEKNNQQLFLSFKQLKETQQQLIEHEKHASLGRLVTGVAHEINTPLGIAVSSSSFLDEGIKELSKKLIQGEVPASEILLALKPMQESMHILSKSIDRTADLVAIFKQVSVKSDLEVLSYFNICEHLRSIFDSLKYKVNKSGYQLQFDCTNTNLHIHSSPNAITAIITSIVDNALSHAELKQDSGWVKITAFRQAQLLKLVISDSGIGMTPEVKKLIFDPFFTTNRKGGGIGLGMHIVFNLVTQQLNGAIECESQQGAGTTLTITLPIEPQS